MRPVSGKVGVGILHADGSHSAAVGFFDSDTVVTLIITCRVIGSTFFRVYDVVKGVGKFRRRYFVQFDVIEKHRTFSKVRVDAVFKIRAVIGVVTVGRTQVRGTVTQPKLYRDLAVFEIGALDINFIGLPILLSVYREIIYGRIAANYDRRAVQRLTVVVQKVRPDAEGKFIILARFDDGFVGSGKVNRTFIRTVYRNHQSVGVGIFVPRFRSFRVYAGEIDLGIDLTLSCIKAVQRVGIIYVTEQIDDACGNVRAAGRHRTARRDRPARYVALYVRSGRTRCSRKRSVRNGRSIGNGVLIVIGVAGVGIFGRRASRHYDQRKHQQQCK